MKHWPIALACVFLFAACALIGIRRNTPTPEPVIIVRVDTLYRPPVPEFIEAFRLQCEWVAR